MTQITDPQVADPQLAPIDPDPDPEIDPDSARCLGGVAVNSFSASPTTVPPFGGGSTLKWTVTVPSDCRVGVMINGRPVPRSGTLPVQPAVTTRYTLSAAAGGLVRTLRSVEVRVDTSSCTSASVPESLIRTEVQKVVRALDAAESRFSLRSDPGVEVKPGGIVIAVRGKLAIDNFADPDIDLDLTVGLRVRNGAVEPFYKSFAVDVDWPWWVTVISAGVSKLVEEFIEDKIENVLRPGILKALKQSLDAFVDHIPGTMRLHSLSLVENQLRVTVCPATGTAAFLVLPARG
jgi:hypothetical protein